MLTDIHKESVNGERVIDGYDLTIETMAMNVTLVSNDSDLIQSSTIFTTDENTIVWVISIFSKEAILTAQYMLDEPLRFEHGLTYDCMLHSISYPEASSMMTRLMM